MATQKNTVTATFPGIGPVEISRERAEQIVRLQRIIKKERSEAHPISTQQIIKHFDIYSSTERMNKITFNSDEKTAVAVRLALVLDSNYYDDIQLDFHSYPRVKVTIYWKGKPDINKFLELESVRKAFMNGM